MPRVYPKDKKPTQSYDGIKTRAATFEKCLHIGNFDICVSEDGERLQIWKGDKLVKSFH